MKNEQTEEKLLFNFSSAFANMMKQIEETIMNFNEAQKQIAESINQSLNPLKDINWEEVEQSWKKSAELLGRRGWTIPMNMTPGEVIGLSKIQNQNKLDLALQDFYSSKKEYENIKKDILDNQLIKEWKTLLTSCFENYENGNYLIVIPSLLIIIENLAHVLITPRYQKYMAQNTIKRKPPLRDQYKKVKREIESDRTYIIYYVSIAEFLNCVFKAGNFDKNLNRLSIINRDWVLHGRDYPTNWKQVDALRLFNAVHTIIELDFLLEDLEKEVHVEELIK